MSRINPRLFYWIRAVYGHPALTTAHRDILIHMAVMKLDFGTGRGYCSVRALAEGCGCHPATVKRALQLARTRPRLLEQTSRGHHLGDGRNHASEWALIYPAMPVDNGFSTSHQSDLENFSTSHQGHLNVAEGPSQRRTGAPPSGIEVPSGNEDSGIEGHRSAIARLQKIDPDVTSEEALAVLADLASRSAVHNPASVLGAEIASGNGWALIERARHRTRKADMAQLDGGRNGQADPGHIADMLQQLRAANGWPIGNSAFYEPWSQFLGWAEDGQPIGIVCGTAEDMARMADFLAVAEGLRDIALQSSHYEDHGNDPARHEDDEGPEG